MKYPIAAAISVCASILVSPARAECPEPITVPCPPNKYCLIPFDDPCAGEAKCAMSYEPPDPAQTVCHRAGNDYFCEAWPQGPELTYTWSSGGSITLLVNGSTASTLQGIYCNGLGTGGWVQLTVTSPFGLSSTETIAVECTPIGGPGF